MVNSLSYTHSNFDHGRWQGVVTSVTPELVRVYFPDVDGGTKQVTAVENIRLGQEWRQGKWHARIPPPLEPAQPQTAGPSPISQGWLAPFVARGGSGRYRPKRCLQLNGRAHCHPCCACRAAGHKL